MSSEEARFTKGSAYQKALFEYLALKAKLLFFFFLGLFLLELGVIFFSEFPKELLGEDRSLFSLFRFPAFLLFAALCEGAVWRYFHRGHRKDEPAIAGWVPYGIATVETLFPTVVMFVAVPLLVQNPNIDEAIALSLPPVFVYFFFIILSALHLDFRLSMFSGFLAGVGYFAVTSYFLEGGGGGMQFLFYLGVAKSVIFLIGGGLAGAIAEMIRRSLESSLEAKDRFIHRLDEKVREKTRELRNKNELLEHRNREITDSIDYARRIQNALLQRKGEGVSQLPVHFIFFKPQSQVSGDFYWMWRTEGSVYMAAMDCTGHGVPGAFMSMLGISQLDEVMAAYFGQVDPPIPV